MQYFYILNVVMFVRNFMLFRDQPLNSYKASLLTFFQILPLFIFRMSGGFLVLILIIIVCNYLLYRLEQKSKKLNRLRFSFLVFQIVVFSFFSPGIIDLKIYTGIEEVIGKLSGISVLFNLITPENFYIVNIVCLGLLFLFNEVNLFIRYIFELSAINQKSNGNGLIDTKGYNAGRVIGILERLIIFILVFINQFAGIGLIIAIKGFTRFKELDKREYAEYVLIGTLLSSLFAVLMALISKSLVLYYK
jgi:hypothetical protein